MYSIPPAPGPPPFMGPMQNVGPMSQMGPPMPGPYGVPPMGHMPMPPGPMHPGGPPVVPPGLHPAGPHPGPPGVPHALHPPLNGPHLGPHPGGPHMFQPPGMMPPERPPFPVPRGPPPSSFGFIPGETEEPFSTEINEIEMDVDVTNEKRDRQLKTLVDETAVYNKEPDASTTPADTGVTTESTLKQETSDKQETVKTEPVQSKYIFIVLATTL